jgi:hypothetical protein
MQTVKTHSLSRLGASAGLTVLAAFGCGDISVEPIQNKMPVTSVVDSDDPYACELVRTEEPLSRNATQVYAPTCKANGTRCMYDGSGSYMVDAETGDASVHQELRMVCAYPCQVDADCPAPESGTAVASCFYFAEPGSENPFGECIMRCDGGETCPDGFECDESRGSTSYAVWPESCIGSAATLDYSYKEPTP